MSNETFDLESLTNRKLSTMLISDKVDIKMEIVTKNTEQHFKMIQYTLYQEDRNNSMFMCMHGIA